MSNSYQVQNYAGDITILDSNIQAAQLLIRLTTEVIRYGMQFAPSNYKVLLHNWREPLSGLLYLRNERLKGIKIPPYLRCNHENGLLAYFRGQASFL